MKKTLCILVLLITLFTGCEKVSTENYKEGTYLGTSTYESYGTTFVATATIYVDNSGKIANCFLDSTYVKDDVVTTKKALGDDYGMKATSESMGVITGGAEWYEQANAIETKVVEEQGLDWVTWSSSDTTKLDVDTISGVTMSANNYIEAISNAIKQAK